MAVVSFHRHRVHNVFLLYLILLVALPSYSLSSLRHESTEVHHTVATRSKTSRELPRQQQYVQDQLNVQMQQQQQRMAQGNNYCDLCQGLTIFPEKLPDTLQSNFTCSTYNFYYQSAWPDPTNETVNYVGTCRSDVGYNYFSDLCCKASIPKYECESNIHELLFSDNAPAPYKSSVPPVVNIEDPLIVSVEIIFQALERIEVEAGTATFFIEMNFRWVDPRLKWTVVDFDTCSNVIDVFTGYEIEKTMIWLPDFDLLNKIEGVQSLSDSKATIHSDGTIAWTVEGGIQAFCAFNGLAEIPFDTVGCQLLFGADSRQYSKLVQYKLVLPDFVGTGTFDLTYNEWTLDALKMEQGMAFDNGVIYYNMYFKRATDFYVLNIVLPTILLTYLSFLTFLLDLRVGERLGFSMALALVVVAQQIVTTGLSPVSNQRLWLDKFVSWSFYWVLVTVFQSVFIGYLYYVREDRGVKKEKIRESIAAERQSMLAERQSMIVERDEVKGTEDGDEAVYNVTDLEEEDVFKQAFNKIPKDSCFHTYSFRKIDMWSLLLASSTYTVFIILMISTVKGGAWLQDEPKWIDEQDIAYNTVYYDSRDPNA